MPAVIGLLLNVLPLIWWFGSKSLPKLVPAIFSVAGRAGIIGTICAVVVKIVNIFKGFPLFAVGLFAGKGVLGHIFSAIRFMLNLGFKFPVIIFISLFLGQYFPNILEKIFLVIGAVAIKVALIFVRWGKGFMDDLASQSNLAQLKETLGNDLEMLPPCMIDVLGYMHIAEDIGIIISTLTFLGIYNLVRHFFLKYRPG